MASSNRIGGQPLLLLDLQRVDLVCNYRARNRMGR